MKCIKMITIAEAQVILNNFEVEHGTEAATLLRLKMGFGVPIGGA